MLAPWKRSYDQPRQQIKKQRRYFADKGLSSQSYCISSSCVWDVSWIIKEAERWRIDAFKLWCQKRLLRVPWTARRSNQSILKEINPKYSLEGLMLKLKLQYLTTWYEEPTHLKRLWCWERLREGGEEGKRGQDGWVASPIQRAWVWANSRKWWRTRNPGVLQFVGSQRVRYDWATGRNWDLDKIQ